MGNPADLTVTEASALLAGRKLGAVELAEACLARIRERDGTHSFEGDPGSINAWIRVYEDDALAAAARADERLARGGAPALCGIPIGLKDIYAVAGKPLTASSRLLDEVPERSCDVWERLEAEGMVLLGHLHTHEFAAGGTTDQVGNPWALDRSAGGSSGGSGAALAARMTPAATGTDTAGSLRIPSAFCGTSTIKPTRGLVPMRGIVPLAESLDHAGPMARTVGDCALLLAAMAGAGGPVEREAARRAPARDLVPARRARPRRRRGLRGDPRPVPRPGRGARRGAARSGDARRLGRRAPDRHARLPPPLRRQARALPPVDPRVRRERGGDRSRSTTTALQAKRLRDAEHWERWFAAERVAALLEPTVPDVAWPRGPGYDEAGSDVALISLTHHWDWTGQPAVALPAGLGAASGLPVSVSLIGPAGSDWELLALGAGLQAELGLP